MRATNDFDIILRHPSWSSIPWLPMGTILFMRGGSHAYGLNTPESDIDFRGVAIPPPAYFHGFLNRFAQAELKGDPDVVVYDIRKFMSLAAEGNPSVLELLFVDTPDVIHMTDEGMCLRENREQFLSQKVKHTFSGYAMQQLKRIATHRRWLLEPPTHKPTRGEFDLLETSVLDASLRGAINSLVDGEEKYTDDHLHQMFGGAIMGVYERERRYHNALREWENYQRWLKTRNPERAANEAKFGYDTKHAMHLVRLMRMCREILTRGTVVVKRPDREELLAVRRGAWKYETLIQWAIDQDVDLDRVQAESLLPHDPNRVDLDYLCQQLVEKHHRRARDAHLRVQ